MGINIKSIQRQLYKVFTVIRCIVLAAFLSIANYSGYSQGVETVSVDEDFGMILPDKGRCFYIEDEKKSLDPIQFYDLFKKGKVELIYDEVPYFDKVSSAHWIGMKLKNKTPYEQRLVLEVDFPYLDSLDFYLWKDDVLVKSALNYSWRNHPESNSLPHRVYAVDFSLSPSESYVWAVRVQKNEGYLPIPIRLFEYRFFESSASLVYILHGITIGFMFLGSILGLTLFFVSKQKMYLYYTGYVFSVTGLVTSEQGYQNQYLSYLLHYLPNLNSWLYFLCFGVVCHIRFSLTFLGIDKGKRGFWVFVANGLSVVALVLLFLAFMPGSKGYLYNPALFVGVCFNIVTLAFILIAIKSKDSSAYLYLIAVVPFLIAAFYMCLSTMGVLPESWIIFELYNFSPLWEIVVLSIGICYVYQHTLKEKVAVQLLLSQSRIAMLSAINIAQEGERERIAKDLHDSIGAMLGALRLNIGFIGTNLLPSGLHQFEATNLLLDETTKEVRRISHDLMPASLAKFGLIAALKELYDNFEKPVVRIIENEFDNCQLDQASQIMLLRIIQELMNNTLKYANASEVSIQFTSLSEGVLFIYEDDGIGFDVSKIATSQGMGFKNISSRVDYLKGKMEVQSTVGKGVICVVEF